MKFSKFKSRLGIKVLMSLGLSFGMAAPQILANESSEEVIEIKDIKSVELYKNVNGEFVEIEELDVQGLNPELYMAKVMSDTVPTFYADVNEFVIEDGEIYLILDIDHSMTVEGDAILGYTKVKYGHVAQQSFETIVKLLAEDPTQDITLYQDLDFNDLESVGTSIFTEIYTGTFDGNGHTIYNLEKPLFEILEGTLKNLTIDGAKVTQEESIISVKMQNATIDNVHIKNSVISRFGAGNVGAFSAFVDGVSSISNSSIRDTRIEGGLTTGGIAARTFGTLTVDNFYFEGEIKSNAGRTGGLIGQVFFGSTTINNSFVDVKTEFVSLTDVAGIIGSSTYTTTTLNNNVSLATGTNGSRVVGTGQFKTVNNFEMAESDLKSNVRAGITEKSFTQMDEAFYFETLGWDQRIWTFDNKTQKPILTALLSKGDSEVSIPNYEYVSQLPQYDAKRDVAYENAFRLMPYLDSRAIVDSVNKLSLTDIMNEQLIDVIYPLDQFGKIVYGLNSQSPDEVATLNVVFEDGAEKTYSLSYDKTIEGVAIYQFNNLPLQYNFEKLVLDLENSIYDELLADVRAIDFKKDIEPITPEADSRLMADWYNEQFVTNLEEHLLEVVESTTDFITFKSNANHEQFIFDLLEKDDYLEKMMYTLNYFDRFYNVEVGMSQLSDMFLLGGETYYHEMMTLDYLIEGLMSSSNRVESKHVQLYNEVLRPLLENQSQLEFLNEQIETLSDYETPDDWFTEEIGSRIGQFRELPMESYPDAIYRAWSLINRRDYLVLPLISATDEVLADLHLTTFPSQIAYGSLNRYDWHLSGSDEMGEIMDDLTARWVSFFEVPADWLTEPVSIFNNRVSVSVDTRFNFPGTSIHYPATTQDPVLKWLYNAWNCFPREYNYGAYSNQIDNFYVLTPLIAKTWSYHTFTHEAAHSNDRQYFYQGFGRRPGTFAEDHADGVIAQSEDRYSYVFNVEKDRDVTVESFGNFTLDRIDSSDDLESYYHNAFDTLYYLDYIAAKAFLDLMPELQAKTTVQANEIGTSTEYTRVSVDEITAMNLQTINDLYDHKLSLVSVGTFGTDLYTMADHREVYWYMPHNDSARTDSKTFKRMGFEFLGEAGYQDGFLPYMSGLGANDLDALHQVMDDETMTYEKYSKARFAEIETFIESLEADGELPTIFNTEDLVSLFTQALQKDADLNNPDAITAVESLKGTLYGIIQRATNEFEDGTVYEMASTYKISTAEQFIDVIENNPTSLGTYEIVADLDFSSIKPNGVAYITTNFVGVINGNGHRITGTTKPLFDNVKYAYFTDIVFEEIELLSAYGLLANRATNSGVKNVSGIDIVGDVSLFATSTGCFTFGENDILAPVASIKIHSIEDLLAINSTEGLTGDYELMADLDFSEHQTTLPIVNGTFKGTFEGNNFTISHTNQPLFHTVSGEVKNLKFEDVTINSGANGDGFGALAKMAVSANLYNIRLDSISVIGKYRIGALVGSSTKSTMDVITVENANITGPGPYVGGLLGRSFSSEISNVYVEGVVSFNDTANGGVIGAVRDNTLLKNIFANVETVRTSNGDTRFANGGLIGHFETNNGKIENTIAYANAMNPTASITGTYKVLYAVDPNNNTTRLVNVYEVNEKSGITSITQSGGVKGVSQNDLDAAFYVETLGWSTDIWNLTGDVPRLYERDVNGNNIGGDVLYEPITSVDDLLSMDRDGQYILMADLDLSGVTTGQAIIEGNFSGKFNGNGYTLTNLKQTLFYNVTGTVHDVTLNDVAISRTGDNFGALARTTNGATIYNVRGSNISVTGGTNRLGALIGSAQATSIDNIGLTNVKISGSGVYVAGLIGRMYQTDLSNVYINGSVGFTKSASGGVVGAAGNHSSIENVFSNVTTTRTTTYQAQRANGGIIGQFETADGSMSHSIAYGNASLGSTWIPGVYKVLWIDDAMNTPLHLTNVYEIEEATGLTSVKENGGVTAISRVALNEDFYLTTLGWSTDVWDLSGETPQLHPLTGSVEEEEEEESDEVIEIHSVEQLQNMKLDRDYVLMADLDVRELTGIHAIIKGTYTGSFDGNGFTISCLNVPLFDTLSGSVTKLTLMYPNISATDYVGALAKTSVDATVSHIRMHHGAILGTQYIGGLVGQAKNSEFENIKVTNLYLEARGMNVGGVIGEMSGTMIQEVYVDGNALFRGTNSGGVIGSVMEGSILVNALSNMSITSISATGETLQNGGLIGFTNTPQALILQSIVLGQGYDTYKVIGANNSFTTTSRITTVFEVTDQSGLTSVTASSGIQAVSKSQLNADFYQQTLLWSSHAWDFSTQIPTLKEDVMN